MPTQTRIAQLSPVEQQAVADFLACLDSSLEAAPLSVTLFGSRARGDADAASDMDLLVVLPEVTMDVRDKIRDFATDISLKYGIYLSTRVWSEEYFEQQAKERSSLYQNVSEDGIKLFLS